MNRIIVGRTSLSVISAVLFLSVSQLFALGTQILNIAYADQIIGLVFATAGASLAHLVANYALKQYKIRRWIMGRKHIEGHWQLITEPTSEEDEDSPLLHPGVVNIGFDPMSFEYTVRTARLNQNDKEYWTISEVAHIRTTGPNIRYLNFFNTYDKDFKSCNGFSSGVFISSDRFHKIPNRLEAAISVEMDCFTRNQHGKRIPDREVDRRKKDNQENWILDYLKEINGHQEADE